MSRVRRLDTARARAGLHRLARDRPDLAGSPQLRGALEWLDTTEDGEDTMTDEVKDAQLVVRMPTALLERLDAYAERLRADMPGAKWARADVARMLLSKALDAADEGPALADARARRGRPGR